jgi:hypothetical protein
MSDEATIGTAPQARYRLTHHPKDVRHGKVIFEGSVAREPDPEDTAVSLLRGLTVQPGEAGDDRLGSYSPAQLDWCMHYAHDLRAAVAARLGWSDASEATIRAELDVVSEVRAELRAGARYRLRLGVVEVSAHTQREAKATLAAAIGAQCATTPAVRVGSTTSDVYVMYPLGLEYVVQLVHPRRPEQPLGVAARYRAASLPEALSTLEDTVRRREQAAVRARSGATPPPATALAPKPSKRPTARAATPSGRPRVSAAGRVA